MRKHKPNEARSRSNSWWLESCKKSLGNSELDDLDDFFVGFWLIFGGFLVDFWMIWVDLWMILLLMFGEIYRIHWYDLGAIDIKHEQRNFDAELV